MNAKRSGSYGGSRSVWLTDYRIESLLNQKVRKILDTTFRMKLTFDVEEALSQCKTLEDISGKNGLLKRMLKEMTEQILEAELTEHLGYEKHSPEGNNSGNSCNGKTAKCVRSDFGEVKIETPRDRNGTFEPSIVKKRQSDISDFDERPLHN